MHPSDKMDYLPICLFLLTAIGAVNALPALREQIAGPNTPIVLDNSDILPGAVSRVSVICSGGTVSLTLTTNSALDVEAEIRIGPTDGPNVCTLPRAPVDASFSIATATGETCGRRGDAVSYLWDAEVTEWFPRPTGLVVGPFTAQFTVQCNFNPQQPTLVPGFSQPPPVTEGTAQFNSTVPFTLEVALGSTSRRWMLNLRPTNVAQLGGLSYTINDLTASTRTATNTAKLISNGCIADPQGLAVQAGTAANPTTVITIAAFQFVDQPNVPIDFSVTVNLCSPVAPNTVCNPVRPTSECSTPRDLGGNGTPNNSALARRTPRSVNELVEPVIGQLSAATNTHYSL